MKNIAPKTAVTLIADFLSGPVFSPSMTVQAERIFAILQPRCTEAQLPEAPMPRAVLKTSRTPDKKNFSQFQFSPDGKLLATWSIAPAGMFGFGSGCGGDCLPFNFKLWDVSTAEELMKVIEVFGGFAFSPDSKALLICDGMTVSGNSMPSSRHTTEPSMRVNASIKKTSLRNIRRFKKN